MCQLIVKDFELCFGSDLSSKQQIISEQKGSHLRRSSGNNYSNRDVHPGPDESSVVPEHAPDVKPYARKSKHKVMFVQAYLLPLAQLLELICHLTGVSQHEI